MIMLLLGFFLGLAAMNVLGTACFIVGIVVVTIVFVVLMNRGNRRDY
jgi:hypothetical protein